MTAEEMKLKCLEIAKDVGKHLGCWSAIADAIAAIPVEPERTVEPRGCPTPGACSCLREADERDDIETDMRQAHALWLRRERRLDDQIAALREALKRARTWINHHIEHGSLSGDWYDSVNRETDAIDAALAATEPKRNAPLSQTRDLDPGEGNNITNVERYPG